MALLAALAYSLATVLVRKRLEESNFFSACLVITVIGNIILWPLTLLFTNLRTVNPEGILFFVLAGLLSPGVTRLLYFKGVEVVGVSVTTPIFATYPLYTSILAVLLLNETLVLENWVGIICIITGVIFVERSLVKPKTKTGLRKTPKKCLIFPLLATLTVTFSHTARKHGLNIYNEPLLGVALGYSVSLLLYILLSIFHFSFTTQNFMSSGKDFKLFWKPGFCLSLAWFLTFHALSIEKLSVVTPIIQTEPLFVLIFTYLYLKELEHLSFKLIIGTLLIVIGVVLVSIR